MDRSLTVTGGDLWNVLTSREERCRRAAALFAMIGDGQLTPTIAAILPTSQGSAAHERLEGRGTIGKIVLTA